MKQKINVLALIAGAMLLQGCGGGSMLGTSDSDDYKLIPDVVTEDLAKPRPSANAAVIKTDGTKILSVNDQEVLLRGINLQFGDDPLGRINGVEAIRETGSNVVRLVLRADTSPQNLEAALNKVVEHNMFAVLTLWEPEPALACTDNEQALIDAVNNLWLDEWLPIIVQDRYQAHIMINIASGWGPKEIFDGYSVGYKTYIDNYKAVIRQFRRAGFKLPLVIDAPGCGSDYHAFVSGRAKELMAADDEKNLILSVHGYGNTWNSGDKVVAAVGQLQSQNIPVIMSEFGGSDLGENPVKHMAILEKGAGDYAIDIAVPWKSAADKAALFVPLDAPVDISNTEVSLDIHLDTVYIEDGTMGVQMYLRDSSDRYANLSWHSAGEFTANQWNTRKYTVKNNASFGWADPDFDITSVAKVGIELVANGKPAEVLGNVKIDNLKIIEGASAEELFSQNFEVGIEGWNSGWAGTVVTHQDSALALTRPAGTPEVIALLSGLTDIDFTQPIQISARVFVPEGYSGSWMYFKFFNNDSDGDDTTDDWRATSDFVNFTVGGWTEVTLTAEFDKSSASSIGIQMGNLGVGDGTADASFLGSVLIDDLVISGISSGGEMELGTQYHATFDADEDGFAYLSWGAAATVVAQDGSLAISPNATDAMRVVVQKNNWGAVEFLNLTDPFTIKTRIMIPASYAGTAFDFKIFMQDVNWGNHFDVRLWDQEELVAGEWNDLVVEVEFPEAFDRSGVPKHFGFEINSDSALSADAILMEEFIIEGWVPIEKEDVIVGLVDFHYASHFENFAVDYVEGELTVDDFAEAGSVYQRSAPFHWIAWSWFGNTAEFADWDLTMSVDNSEHLTQRGDEIVNGKGGIQEFAPVQEEVDVVEE